MTLQDIKQKEFSVEIDKIKYLVFFDLQKLADLSEKVDLWTFYNSYIIGEVKFKDSLEVFKTAIKTYHPTEDKLIFPEGFDFEAFQKSKGCFIKLCRIFPTVASAFFEAVTMPAIEDEIYVEGAGNKTKEKKSMKVNL